MNGMRHPTPASPAQRPLRRGWWTLLRPPNLLTVPGDPLAGFLLASAAASAAGLSAAPTGAAFALPGILDPAWARAGVAVAAALLIYLHGLIGNDLFDRKEDQRERPERPLPAGLITPRAATTLCLLTAAAGIALSWLNGSASFGTALLLTATVLLYNGVMKRFRILGPLFMGACRALGLAMGAVAAGWRGEGSAPTLVAIGLLGLYVAAVTAVAQNETRATTLGFRRWLPAGVLAIGFGGVGWASHAAGIATWGFALVLGIPTAAWAGWIGHRLAGQPAPQQVQASIGHWLRGLLVMQFCLASIGWGSLTVPGAVCLALWACHVRLARRYYCT